VLFSICTVGFDMLNGEQRHDGFNYCEVLSSVGSSLQQ
jgi:hypothetical protein